MTPKRILAHRFCKRYGIAPSSEVTLPDSSRKIALDLRANDVPFAHLSRTEFHSAAL